MAVVVLGMRAVVVWVDGGSAKDEGGGGLGWPPFWSASSSKYSRYNISACSRENLHTKHC